MYSTEESLPQTAVSAKKCSGVTMRGPGLSTHLEFLSLKILWCFIISGLSGTAYLGA